MQSIHTIVSRASTHSRVSAHNIEFQGVKVATSMQMYGNYIPGKYPCGPKSRVMFKASMGAYLQGHYGNVRVCGALVRFGCYQHRHE